MRIATLILLIAVLLTLVYIAVILKKNLAVQVSPEDMKKFMTSMAKEVPQQVENGISRAFAPAPDNVGVGRYVS